jgi:hypothetical protein
MAMKLNFALTAVLRVSSVACAIVLAASSLYFAWAGLFAPIDPKPWGLAGARAGPAPFRLAGLEEPWTPTFAPEALLAQPLFSPTRTEPLKPALIPMPEPEPAAALPASAALKPAPDYFVSGIIISPSVRKVLLRKHKGEKGWWINEGTSTPEGWKVLTVTPEKVNLALDSQEASLFLHSRMHHVLRSPITGEQRAVVR